MTNYDSADFFREGGAGLSVLPGATWRAGRFFRMVFRVVRAKARRASFCPVAKQDSKTQGGLGRRAVQNAPCARGCYRCFPGNSKAALPWRSLDYDVEDIVVFQKDGGSAGRAQKREHSSAKTRFFRQRLQKRSILADCVFRSMLDGKSQLCGEAKTPHDTKRVFGKAVEGCRLRKGGVFGCRQVLRRGREGRGKDGRPWR